MKRSKLVFTGIMAAFLTFAALPQMAFAQDDDDIDSYSAEDSDSDESSFGEESSFGSEPASSPAAPARTRQAFTSTASGTVINVPGEHPTISAAMTVARMGDSIIVAPGVYRERIIMAPGVHLVSKTPYEASIRGGGKGTVVTMSRGSTIHGFEITDGTIGIFSSDIGNSITSCRIVKNWMTGIITVRHLPRIEDNIIAFNRASGIQGWDVRSTAATVNHNSIAFNGNHGIALGGANEFIIENNIIAFNERFGLKILEQPEKIQVTDNNFFKNLYQPGKPLPENNHSFDPAFIAPRSGMNFKPDPGTCCKAKSSEDENLGVRFNW